MKSLKNRLFFSIMTFAFLWVIIGDLVSMHIHVIYNIDIQNEQPFSKTDKNDIIKKGKSGSNDTLSFSFFIETNNSLTKNISTSFSEIFTEVQNNLKDRKNILYKDRAPPIS